MAVSVDSALKSAIEQIEVPVLCSGSAVHPIDAAFDSIRESALPVHLNSVFNYSYYSL